MSALPIALSEGCVLRRDIPKDDVLSFDDVDAPQGGLAAALWREQNARWPLAGPEMRASSMQPAPVGALP
jgi:predicted homoserine dehydrogenase-like protein